MLCSWSLAMFWSLSYGPSLERNCLRRTSAARSSIQLIPCINYLVPVVGLKDQEHPYFTTNLTAWVRETILCPTSWPKGSMMIRWFSLWILHRDFFNDSCTRWIVRKKWSILRLLIVFAFEKNLSSYRMRRPTRDHPLRAQLQKESKARRTMVKLNYLHDHGPSWHWRPTSHHPGPAASFEAARMGEGPNESILQWRRW